MSFGLESRHWETLSRLLITPLKNAGCSVWVFGSRARGDHKPFSDIDVLYSCPEGTPISFEGTLIEALENSDLPIKVDLVNEQNLAESYRANILRERVSL